MCWNEKEVHLYNPVIQDHLARRSWVRIPPRARVSQPPVKLVRVVRIPLTISVKQMRLTWHTHSVQHSRRYRSYVFVPLNRRTIHSFRHHVEGLFYSTISDFHEWRYWKCKALITTDMWEHTDCVNTLPILDYCL